MAKSLSFKFDAKAWFEQVSNQFRNLDTKTPWFWPLWPRCSLFFGVIVVIITVLWFVWLTNSQAELTQAQEQEVKLREEYKSKLNKAVNLDALKKQREQVQQYVTQLEKQLPSKAEMDALLSDINQAGIGRSLQFDLFRPGQVAVREYYAELPIALRVTGRFHDLGSFASDISNLSRIVTLNNMSIVSSKEKEGTLTMNAVAKTFRYLDQNEISAQRKAATKGAKK